VYTLRAQKDLRKLEHSITKRILKKLDFFLQQEDFLSFAEPIEDDEHGDYRFRIGDYRVLFDLDRKGSIRILTVLRIKHRKDIYR
jgi:mRNA interferase RelE/StbE